MSHATPPPLITGKPVITGAPISVNINSQAHEVCKTDQQAADEDQRMRREYPAIAWPTGIPNESWTMDILDGQDRVIGTVRCDHGRLTLMKPEVGR